MRLSSALVSMFISPFFLSLLLALTSCTVLDKGSQIERDHVFQIAILDAEIKTLPKGLGQDWQTAWPVLQMAYPSKVSYVITENDIDSYDWSEQVLTLTDDASKSMLEKYDCSTDCNNDKRECLQSRAFIVVYQDKPIYGGIFLADYPMAARFQYPIIYPALSAKARIVLTIRSQTSITKTYNTDDWVFIKDKRIEDLFDRLGKLVK